MFRTELGDAEDAEKEGKFWNGESEAWGSGQRDAALRIFLVH